MAAILYRYASFKGYDVSARNNLSAFKDKPSDWALESTGWDVAVKLINGKGEGVLDPQGDATRAEAAATLMRFSTQVAK